MFELFAQTPEITWPYLLDKALSGLLPSLAILAAAFALWLRQDAAKREAEAARIAAETLARKQDAANKSISTELKHNTEITQAAATVTQQTAVSLEHNTEVTEQTAENLEAGHKQINANIEQLVQQGSRVPGMNAPS